MEYKRWQYYERQYGIQESVKQSSVQGISHQKAENEKIIAQKDAEISKLMA